MLPCEITPAFIDVAVALHQMSFDKAWSKEDFLSLLSLETTKGWIDKTGLLLVSHVLDEIEILTILTHPDFRGQGRARFFLNHLISYAKEKKVSQIFLEVNAVNQPAIHLYEKIGFQKVSIRKNYYKMKDGSFKDAFVYVLKI